jgi:peptide/nickel transport system substrate-binding protein
MARRTWKMLTILFILALTATACGSNNNGSPSATKSGGAAGGLLTYTPTPTKAVSQITWNLPHGEPTSLDWTLAYNFSENEVVANMCDSLLRLEPNYSIQPGLATSYSNPNPTTWVYNIRQGVKFWDGNPMTTADVVYSLSRNLSVNSYWNLWYTYVKTIQQTGPYQVTVILKQPFSLFNEIMAVDGGDVGEEAYVQREGSKYGTPQGGVMCTGPFEFSKWVAGQSITLTRNPDYWDKSLEPHVQTLQFLFLQDAATITSALESGQLSGTYEPPYSAIGQLQDSGVVNVYAGPSMEVDAIYGTTSPGPFRNPLIRQALLLAIDRQAIATTMYSGYATPLRAYAAPPTWGYEKSIFSEAYAKTTPPEVNLAAARKLVAEAGSPKGPIVIAALNTTIKEQEATVVESAGQSIGLNVQVKILPPDLFDNLFFTASARSGVSGILESTYPEIADPLELYYEYFSSITPYNYANFSTPQLQTDLTQAVETSSPATRAKAVVSAQSILLNDMVWIPLVDQDNVLVMNKDITGAPAAADLEYFPWAAMLGGS